jgi:hypothetical protein
MTDKIPEFLQVEIDGKLYLQVRSNRSRWGFYITDGYNLYDGGFGLVKYSGQNKPAKKKSPRLEKLARAIKRGEYVPIFSRNALMTLEEWIGWEFLGY